MTRRVLTAVLAAGVCSCLLITEVPAASDPVFSQIDSIVKVLAQISGLSEMHPVPYGRMSKRQLRTFLTKRIKRTLKPEEIYADELALKMFGFVPDDFDLRQSTVELLTEQAAAFYDYDMKKLFLLEDSSVNAETVTLAHELSHALADQHFHLGNFMDDTPSNDDENLAHSAVVEGQASWLMIAYSLQLANRPPVPTPEMLASVEDSGKSSMDDFPVLKDSPLYIQQSLLFPYVEGVAFFDAVYKKMGKQAFASVFTNPPTDSAQIMHPEKYFAHAMPAHPDLPVIEGEKGAEEATEGSVGEFDHKILIRQFAGAQQANQLSPHVQGGQFKIVRDPKTQQPLLEYSSEWDSPESAAAFFALYPRIIMGKWKHCDITTSRPRVLAGTGDSGYFVSRLNGRTVQSIEGLSNVTEWQKLTLSSETAATLH